MTKHDFIGAIAAKTGYTRKATEEVVNATLEVITETLAKKDAVKLPGFGTFSTVDHAAREGRNPLTGEPMTIEASTTPRFKAGTALKAAVR